VIFRRGGSFFCLFACAGWEHFQQNRKRIWKVQNSKGRGSKGPNCGRATTEISNQFSKVSRHFAIVVINASPPSRISWMFPTLAHLTTVPSHIGEYQ
jgi:hypothetical protein